MIEQKINDGEKMSIEYPVKCPITDEWLDMGTCFDIHMVVSGEAPEWTAPISATSRDNYKDICNNCPYHRND